MTTRRIPANDIPWTAPADGVRHKLTISGGRKVRLVEFATGFAEADWCCAAHIGYVLEGWLEVAFTDAVEVFCPGDVVMIGADDKHRARVIEGPVRLFLVEEA